MRFYDGDHEVAWRQFELRPPGAPAVRPVEASKLADVSTALASSSGARRPTTTASR